MTVLLITNAADILGLFLLTYELVRLDGAICRLLLSPVAIALPSLFVFAFCSFRNPLFRRFPFRALAQLAGILEFASLLFSPLLELGARFGKLLLPERAARSVLGCFAGREEVKQITEQSEREGSLTATERAMIHNVVDFRSVK